MSEQIKRNREILDELVEIVTGVHSSFFSAIKTLSDQEESEGKFKDLYEKFKALKIVQPYEGFRNKTADTAPTLPKRALDFALKGVDDLISRSEECSTYAQEALQRYRGVIVALIDTEDSIIRSNLPVFTNLSELGSYCMQKSEFYMRYGGRNKCRGSIYKTAQGLQELQDTVDQVRMIDGDEFAQRFETAAQSFDNYLQMCGECPFREYHRQTGGQV